METRDSRRGSATDLRSPERSAPAVLRPRTAPPRQAYVDETVRRSVLALLEGNGLRRDALVDVLEVGRSTVFHKLGAPGRPGFTAGELDAIAAFFGVPVTDLFDGLGGRFLPREEPGPDDAVTASQQRALVPVAA